MAPHGVPSRCMFLGKSGEKRGVGFGVRLCGDGKSIYNMGVFFSIF